MVSHLRQVDDGLDASGVDERVPGVDEAHAVAVPVSERAYRSRRVQVGVVPEDGGGYTLVARLQRHDRDRVGWTDVTVAGDRRDEVDRRIGGQETELGCRST